MKAKLGVLATLVLLATAVGAVVGASSASGQRTIHVIFGAPKHTKVAVLDHHDDGLRLADRLAAHGPLMDPSRSQRVGTGFSDCVVQHPITSSSTGLFWCKYILALADGKIVVEGLDPHGVSKTVFAVTGGTGEYQTSRGQATFTDSRTDTDILVELR